MAEPGLCKAIDTEELEPFTAAQYRELNRIINSSLMQTLDTFTDLIIGKVHTLIANEMQTFFNPVRCDLRNQIKFLQREFLILQNEYFSNPVPVQNRMKRYAFKRRDDSDSLHDPDEPNLVHGASIPATNLVHSLHDPNLMQPPQLHVGDEPNLVRYFEKLVRDEVSSCSSVHDLLDPNLMQPSQINTGETLKDCIDFDELLNDVHSTAASAQLLRYSLSGYSSEPTP